MDREEIINKLNSNELCKFYMINKKSRDFCNKPYIYNKYIEPHIYLYPFKKIIKIYIPKYSTQLYGDYGSIKILFSHHSDIKEYKRIKYNNPNYLDEPILIFYHWFFINGRYSLSNIDIITVDKLIDYLYKNIDLLKKRPFLIVNNRVINYLSNDLDKTFINIKKKYI